ncbi:hypothetical protein ECSTECDG1313_1725 [Escherichia coli STEC_DG131-3]|jgi:hypothetical protein|nr:hypothetical protein ECSTECDG1313_1725 [Escherichia coli STEC_DG131-3]
MKISPSFDGDKEGFWKTYFAFKYTAYLTENKFILAEQ